MRPLRSRQTGFSLVELMVAVTVGLLMLAGLSSLFAGNNHAQMEIERANRQVENGRYAMQLLTGDLRNAGFLGEFDPAPLTPLAAMPSPCSTTLADIKAAFATHVQGYDNGSTLTCITDVKANTDILVVRHASTCIVGAADCSAVADGGVFFKASLCNNQYELGSGAVAKYYQVETDTDNFDMHKRDCTVTEHSGTAADLRLLQTHIYFIAQNSNSGDGVPTLKRAEITTKDGEIVVKIVPLAEGIENMQIEYGLDTDANGVADLFTPTPATAKSCTADACAVTNWGNVVSLKMHLLARTLTPAMGQIDKKSYVLGLKADGTANTIAATNDKYKRHVFSSVIGLPNPAGRKSS